MDFATGALGFLLPKLAQLLKDEYNLQKGVRKDIEFLSSELEIMHAALCKVGKVPREQLSELKRIWARDVRELSYDMEDIVDTFTVSVEGLPDPPSKSRAKEIIMEMTRKVTKAMNRRGIAQETKDIKNRVKEIAKKHGRYNRLDTITPAQTHIDPRIKALYTDVTELVGIDEAKQEVIMRLTSKGDGNQQRRIVSIVGFGGLGKTTLAKAVYDEIKGEFDCTAFVSVSSNPDTNRLLRNMMYDLDKKKFEGALLNTTLHETHLINLVREFLQNKRYLIVIDDIWDVEPWDNVIGLALIKNNMGSIITTTRKIDVAEHVGGCYKLKQLSDESSEILFYGRIFGSKDEWPRQFREVSQKILKKCGGVPLAIVTVSSLLANKSENIKEWNNVCDSIGSGLESNPGMDSMRKILLLSYYDLPSHLKTCLLYLSIFPEDYEITKERLIWLWVAEGFVQDPQGGQSFHEIGESYFNGLLNRSLIQPANMDEEGTPQACRVHDTVLDLIVSLSKEECFVSTVLGDEKHRRLSLHNSTSSWPTMKMRKLRSLIIFKPNDVVIDPMPSLSCHLLRVLDLRGCTLEDFASLGFLVSLSHLRYLGLSSNNNSKSILDSSRGIDHLPEEIGKLQFLQTLDLSRTAVRGLPSSIIGLRQLRCLRGSGARNIPGGGYRTRLPDAGLKNLDSLEVLEGVEVSYKCIIAKELEYLTQLRVLEAKFDLPSETDDGGGDRMTCAKPLVDSLGKLSKIESVDNLYNGRGALCFDGSVKLLGNLRRLHFDHFPTDVPTWIKGASLPVLSYLYLHITGEQRREDIQVLGKLPCLRHVSLTASSYKGRELERCEVGPDAFPRLVSCDLRTDSVVPSTFPPGGMSRLQDFTFSTWVGYFCSGGDRFTVDDLGLAHLPSLRTVSVDGLHDERWYYDKDSEEYAVFRRLREKLEQEAAVHPNNPRINFL
ncbi:unnamed protein product [Urochloa humidicola]